MKKIIVSVFALILVVSGCASTNTSISDSKTLLTVNGTSITEADVYQGLKSLGNINPLTAALDKAVVDEAVKTTKEIEKEAKASFDSYKSSIAKDKWEETLKAGGYKDEDDYYERVSLVNAKLPKVTDAYISKNFDELAERYEVKKMRIFVTNDAKKAASAAEALTKKDADFEKITAEFGDTSKYDGKEGIYTKYSGLPSVVVNKVKDLKDKEISETIADADNSTFYIVQLVSSKAKDFKDEAKTAIKGITEKNENGLSLEEEAYNYFLKASGYDVHDTDIYAALLLNSKKYSRD